MKMIEALIAKNTSVSLTSTCERYQSTEPGLPILLIKNDLCEAVIALQGAHLLEFKPHNGKPLLWLSPNATFTPGKAIRGGIPVCLPWFGVNQQAPDKPKHGFARNRDWQLDQVNTTEERSTQLTFTFDYKGLETELFAYSFTAQLQMTLGKDIEITLTVTNNSDQEMPFTWALHSYHPIASLEQTQVEGLDGIRYLDNTNGLNPDIQSGAITFTGEVDKAYEKVGTTQIIKGDPGISITGSNCDSAIVWNPGAKNAANIADIGTGVEKQFICVERGATYGDGWALKAKEQRISTLKISPTSIKAAI